MTDARTLLERAWFELPSRLGAAENCGQAMAETPSGQALLALAAEADTLRERVAALEGWVQMLTEGSPWSEDHSCIGCGRRQYRIEPPIGQGHAADCAYINARAAIAATDQRGAVCGLDCDACRAYMEPETEGDAVLPGHPRPTQPTPDPSPSAALVEALVRDLHRLGYTSPDTKARVQAIAAAARAEGLDGLEEPAGHPYEEGRNGKCAVCGERPDPEPWHPTAARARRPGGDGA